MALGDPAAVNTRGVDGTPVFAAASNGHAGTIRTLVNTGGADVNIGQRHRCKKGRWATLAPITAAADKHHLDALKVGNE